MNVQKIQSPAPARRPPLPAEQRLPKLENRPEGQPIQPKIPDGYAYSGYSGISLPVVKISRGIVRPAYGGVEYEATVARLGWCGISGHQHGCPCPELDFWYEVLPKGNHYVILPGDVVAIKE